MRNRCQGNCGVFVKSNATYCTKCAPKVGYNECGCPSCFEVIIGVPSELCDECKEAGCGDSNECSVERCECGGSSECYCEESVAS